MRRKLMGTTPTNTASAERSNLTYVLITPARNEEAFIEQTIKSVVRQTVLPLKWVIVSDGSTDRTDDIVQKYAAEYKWIELVRKPVRAERHFAGKVDAFNTGYSQVKDLKYDIIGSLDADISFDPEFFDFLLNQFTQNPKLGLAGTPFREDTGQYDYRFTSIDHVSGACQLFRKECFESIGGYVPIKGGGIDLVAVINARIKGWQTRTFPGKYSKHHRNMSSAKHGPLVARFKDGQKDYVLGAHPVWEVFRSVYQMSKNPIVIGGSYLLAGYLWAMMRRVEKPVSGEFVAFRRNEQMHRLKEFFVNLLFR